MEEHNVQLFQCVRDHENIWTLPWSFMEYLRYNAMAAIPNIFNYTENVTSINHKTIKAVAYFSLRDEHKLQVFENKELLDKRN
jgi:hypothetical protein